MTTDYSQPLCPELDAFILSMAPPHVALDYAPGNLQTLKEYVQKFPDSPLPVWNGCSDRTIYGSPEVNWAARAWHDSIHLKLNRDTDLAGEYLVSRYQLDVAERYGSGLYMNGHALALLWLDTWGQQLY